jgi:asparagine synthase (glutamine-hydrolysing)
MQRLGEKVHKGAPMLRSESLGSLYDQMLSVWPASANVVSGSPSFGSSENDRAELDGISGVERMMAQDMLGYLADDILVKVDRAAMAVSLETRVPLLDPEVVQFAWRLPLDLKLRGSQTKWLLRQVLYRHVPKDLIERPKMGFGIPLDSWLRGPLRDWAEALLDRRRLDEQGYFHPSAIRTTWRQQLQGRNNSARLWTVLMFQSWLEGQGASSEGPQTALAGGSSLSTW